MVVWFGTCRYSALLKLFAFDNTHVLNIEGVFSRSFIFFQLPIAKITDNSFSCM